MARILIVEDSKFSRMKIADTVSEMGHETVEASDGKIALQITAEQKLDCILCDLLMPGLDGFEFLKTLRRDNFQIPVIIITADIQETTEKSVLELGAAAVVKKPPKVDELVEIISSVL